SGFLTIDNITATFNRAPGEDVNTYHITTALNDPNDRLSNYTVANAGANFMIAPASPGIAVTSNLEPSAVGQSVKFTAVVAPAGSGALPTGTVQFKIDGSPIGGLVTLTASGTAVSIATASWAAGNHTVTAAYSGNPNYTTATGATIQHVLAARPFTTYTQGGWGAAPNGNNPGVLLKNNFSSVYSSGVEVGRISPDPGKYSVKFATAANVEDFLPAGGKASMLVEDKTNPLSTAAGVFAGQVLTLQLSVDFSNKGVTQPGLRLLKIAAGKPLAGKTVQEVLDLANKVIGGSDLVSAGLPSGFTLSQLNDVVDSINNNFDNGSANRGFLVQ
ncbi:MAG TPA: Ig-like domain-containing protein, partial [Vicinamibacterales bacterium]|nr:Ig-like domain-containing protein [Vicinamibacterales bacterium]